MYVLMQFNITIGALTFDYVDALKVKRSWRELTDTARIQLPRKLKLKDRLVEEVIQTGDVVKIETGWNDQLNTEFEGYVARSPKPGVPVVVECEDEMWRLKRLTLQKTFEDANLTDIVNYIATKYQATYNTQLNLVVDDIALGEFIVGERAPVNGAQVLQYLKKEYGIVSYFRGKVLHSGRRYFESYSNVTHYFQRLQAGILSDDLEYRKAEDVKIEVKAISKQPDNSTIEVTVGESGGDTRTMHFYNLPQAELQKRAEEEIDKIKIDGYSGKYTSYVLPYCDHGDTATIVDNVYPEREGTYFIDAVEVECGRGGGRRIVELGKLAL